MGLFKHGGAIFSLNSKQLKSFDQFKYLGSNIASTKAISISAKVKHDRLTNVLKSVLFDKIKPDFFQPVSMSVLLNGCTTLTKFLGEKLDGNFTEMLLAFFNKSWKQDPTKQQLYGHLPPISQTIEYDE